MTDQYEDLVRRLDTAENTWKGTVPIGRGMYESLFYDASSAIKALEAKLAIAVEALVCIVDFHIYGPSKRARDALAKIKETK